MKKHGKPMTRIAPEPEKICTGKELAEAIAHVELSPVEAIAWSIDLGKARKALKTPEDKWR